MEVTGVIKVIEATQQVSDKFKKKEFVLELDGQYPQPILMQLVNDKCSLLDNIYAGTKVTVAYNLKGREWNSPQGETKYFNTIEAWKITKVL